MKKRIISILLMVIFIFLDARTVFAYYFIDDMDNIKQDEIKTYYNLSPVVHSGSGAWSSLPDKSFASFSQASQSLAKVIYKINSAESINAGIYTYSGTFAQKLLKDGDEAYVLGFDKLNKEYSSYPPGYMEQARFSPSALAAFIRDRDKILSVIFDDCYVFSDISGIMSTADPADEIGYGLNIYTSQDGEKYQRQQITAVSVDYRKDSCYCYEEYSAKLPLSAKYVMVEINDFSRYYDTDSKRYEVKTSRAMTSLAYVSIYGGRLVMGDEKVVITPELPSVTSDMQESVLSGSSEQSKSSSAKASLAKSQAGSKVEEEDSNPKPSSKFEGSIVISGSSPKSSSSAKPQQSSKSSQSSESEKESLFEAEISRNGQASPESLPLPSEGTVYHTQKNNDSDNFNTGVTGYIIVAVISIVIVIKLSWKK